MHTFLGRGNLIFYANAFTICVEVLRQYVLQGCITNPNGGKT